MLDVPTTIGTATIEPIFAASADRANMGQKAKSRALPGTISTGR